MDESQRLWKVISDPDAQGSLAGCIMGDCELSWCLWWANLTLDSQIRHRKYGTFTVQVSDIQAHFNQKAQPQMLKNGAYQVRSNGEGRVIIEAYEDKDFRRAFPVGNRASLPVIVSQRLEEI